MQHVPNFHICQMNRSTTKVVVPKLVCLKTPHLVTWYFVDWRLCIVMLPFGYLWFIFYFTPLFSKQKLHSPWFQQLKLAVWKVIRKRKCAIECIFHSWHTIVLRPISEGITVKKRQRQNKGQSERGDHISSAWFSKSNFVSSSKKSHNSVHELRASPCSWPSPFTIGVLPSCVAKKAEEKKDKKMPGITAITDGAWTPKGVLVFLFDLFSVI